MTSTRDLRRDNRQAPRRALIREGKPGEFAAVGRPRLPREHGTERGYQQHRTWRDPACGRCLLAHQQHNTKEPAVAVPPIPLALAHLGVDANGILVPFLRRDPDVDIRGEGFEERWILCWSVGLCRECGRPLQGRVFFLGTEEEAALWFVDPPVHIICASYLTKLDRPEVSIIAEGWNVAYDGEGKGRKLIGGTPSGEVRRRVFTKESRRG